MSSGVAKKDAGLRKISKAIFEVMVEKASDGLFVYQEGEFFYVNPAFRRNLGYRRGELDGKSLKDIALPDAAQKIEELYAKLISGEPLGENGSPRIDGTFRTAFGVERVISISNAVINVGTGPAILGIARDITERRQMVDALISYNAFLKALIDNSGDAIVVIDMTGKALVYNKAAELITGYKAQDIIDQTLNINDFMEKTERKRIQGLLNQGTAEKPYRVVAEETALTLKDGTVIPISLSCSYVYHEGKPLVGMSIFHDLRAIKDVQDSLKSSEQKYRMLVEKANDGIFVYQDHRFKYTNPKFRELLGYSSEELAGMGFLDIMRPEIAELIESRYEKRIKGEAVPDQYEIALRAKDGSWRAFEITPSLIEYEKRPATQNVIRDITQKRNQQKALRASETKYRTTVEHTGTAIMLLEESRLISLVNRQMEKLTGFTREEMEGKMPFTEIVHPLDQDRMVGYHKARRDGSKDVPSEYEFRLLHKDGSVKDAFLTIGLIPGTRQSIVSIIDITEMKNLERELEKSRKMAALGEMSAHVAHEVRNPLQKIKTGIELLKGSKSLEDRQMRILEGVTSGIDTLEKFVTQILEWTRSGKIKPKSFSLSNIIEGLLFNRMEQCDHHAIEIHTDFDYTHDTLLIDGVQIRQLLENLIENSLDAMPEGGKLSIATRAVSAHPFRSQGHEFTADAMEIIVEDTGIGIGQDDIQLIFQPFYTQKARGTGLGLALVQKITDMHHGEVGVESIVGKGTKFTVRVPMDYVAAEVARSHRAKEQS